METSKSGGFLVALPQAMRRVLWPTSADVTMNFLLIFAVVFTIAAEITFRHYSFPGPYWNLFSADFFVTFALFSLPMMHVLAIKNVREAAAIAAAITLCWVAIDAAHFGFIRVELQKFAYAVGLGSVIVQVIGLGVSHASPAQLLRRVRLARACAMFAIAATLPTPVVRMASFINPTLDHLIAYFDDGFGFRIISLIRAAEQSSKLFHDVLLIVYVSMPIAMALVFVLQKKTLPPLPLTIWLSATVGITLYFMLPSVGPIFVYPEFYNSLWPNGDIDASVAPTVVTNYPRNCMPSLHATWAYLLVFAAHGLSWPIKLSVIVFAGLTLVAAIGIGIHWFSDLVVALPLALAIQALATFSVPLRDPERLQAICVGIGLTIFQLIILFLQPLVFTGSVIFHWATLIATAWCVVVYWNRLARRIDQTSREAEGWQIVSDKCAA